MVETEYELDIVKEDPTDNKHLESALAGKAKYLITGDSHLLKFKYFKGIKIVTPRQFLNLIGKNKQKRTI